MKVNYVLMYGTPYLRYKEFETFEDMSKFIVLKNIVDYTIFEKMEDKKEIEMIYRDNDIKVLEKRIDKAIELIDDWLFNVAGNDADMSFEDVIKIKEKLEGDSNDTIR